MPVRVDTDAEPPIVTGFQIISADRARQRRYRRCSRVPEPRHAHDRSPDREMPFRAKKRALSESHFRDRREQHNRAQSNVSRKALYDARDRRTELKRNAVADLPNDGFARSVQNQSSETPWMREPKRKTILKRLHAPQLRRNRSGARAPNALRGLDAFSHIHNYRAFGTPRRPIAKLARPRSRYTAPPTDRRRPSGETLRLLPEAWLVLLNGIMLEAIFDRRGSACGIGGAASRATPDPRRPPAPFL